LEKVERIPAQEGVYHENDQAYTAAEAPYLHRA
jgi:hypothetical protein